MKETTDNLISIIIPVYNTDKYLEKCLLSVLKQTHRNLEVIVINDGSTDKSENICRKYCEKDSRIKYLVQSNMGLSAARNHGIRESNGEYICFVDSDDYISNNFVSTLLENLLRTQSDFVICNVYSTNEYNDNIFKVNNFISSSFNKREAYLSFLKNEEVNHAVMNKLYKRRIVLENLFPIGKRNEDTFTTYRYIRSSDKISYIDLPLYYYLKRQGSIMHSKFSESNFDKLEALKEILLNVSYDRELEYYAYNNLIGEVLYLLIQSERFKIRSNRHSDAVNFLLSIDFRLKVKMKYTFFIIFLKLYFNFKIMMGCNY